MELLKDKVIYHLETQEDYDDLMRRLEKLGCNWWGGKKMTCYDPWIKYANETCIFLNRKKASFCNKSYYEKYYSEIEIIKYKKEQNPMKVKLKANQRFIADWYEANKDDLENEIFEACLEVGRIIDKDSQIVTEDIFLYWLGNTRENPITTLINMQQFGYEIEQEPLYRVLIPNPNLDESGNKFILEKREKGVILAKRRNKNIYLFEDNQKLTEAEIKKDFAWAWQFAKEV